MARFNDGWDRNGYLPEGSYFKDYRDENGYSPIGSPVYEYIIGDRERQIDQQQPIQPLPMYHSGDDEIFGSQARFNQRRNPNPIDMAQAMNGIENMARINQYGSMARANQYNTPNDAYGNNINNMANGYSLDNILGRMFGSQAEASPAPIPQVKEKSPKGFGRPMVMTYDEYERQYMPYQYAERMQNQMRDNYDNYTQGINLDEYLDRLE